LSQSRSNALGFFGRGAEAPLAHTVTYDFDWRWYYSIFSNMDWKSCR
jgi:hypothetical protein